MRLFVLGATGKTGVELVDIGLARRHQVTAFVRSPEKVTRRDDGLRVIKGDPRSADQLATAMVGHDAVLAALGPSAREAITTATTLMSDTARSALVAMERASVKRYLVVSSALLFHGGGALAGFFRFLIRNHLRDLRGMEEMIASSSSDWTVVRPPRLIESREAEYRAQPDAFPPDATLIGTTVSWRAVAASMIDALESGRYVRNVVGICR